MSYVFCLVLSNCLSFVGFLLVVYYSIHINRDSMLRISMVMTLLTITAYIIISCFNAAVASLFALLRSYICLKYPNLKEGTLIKAANLMVGTAFSMWCAYHGGGTWVDYLPAASFLFCSIGFYLTKSPGALKIINALDIMLFWLVFDYVNLMVFYVVVDLFIVTFPIVEQYVKLDRTDSAEHTQKSNPQNRALGFEKRHTKKDIEGGANLGIAMKDSGGNRVVVASADNMPQDLTGIAINVDNFEEAYDFFIEKGFVDPRGGKVTDTSSSRATMLLAPSGFAVSISEHLKDRD